MPTTTITVHDDATPSAYYPADEQAANGATDYSVTIEIPADPSTIDAIINTIDGITVSDWTSDTDTDGGIVGVLPAWISRTEIAHVSRDIKVAGYTVSDNADEDGVRYLWVGPRTIEGGITLDRDDANGGRLSACGAPIDGWISGEIVKWLKTLTDQSRRAVCTSLEAGVGTETVEVEVRS